MLLHRLRAALLVAVVPVTALALAPAAHAALGAEPCGATGALRCGVLSVPLDRSAAVPGAVGLGHTWLPAAAAPTTEAVVPLAGGPGQAALPFADDFASTLKPLLAGRDLLVFDQRGTGSSGALGCFGDAGPSSGGDVRACAAAIGPARDFYRSVDSAQDIEALRVAGGYSRLVLYGVSYGTRVALTYAAMYPDRVAALVLDSVVPVAGPDVWGRPSFAALSRMLRELCAARACRQATARPSGDLSKFTARLARATLRGSVTGPTGRRVTIRLTPVGLWQTLLAGDLNPTLRAELPGAISAALRGDRTPILRLAARADGLSGTVPTAAAGRSALATSDVVNTSLFTATRCSETAFPWNPASSPATRLSQAAGALRKISSGRFKPFQRAVAFSQSIVSLCASWPGAPLAAPVLGPLPQVPTLVLEGAADLRTPVEQARSAVAAIPGARIVPVIGTGHSVLGSDVGGCADDEIAAFAAGTSSNCRPVASPFTPTPRPPRRLSQLPGGTKALRTVAAVRATITDVRRQLIGDAIAAGQAVAGGARTGGLRGGVATVDGDVIRLSSVSYVPNVRVSGTYAPRIGQASRLVVTGSAAARGRLDIDGTGRARGVLGGRRVEAVLTASSASRGDAAWGAGLELPRFPSPGLRSAAG